MVVHSFILSFISEFAFSFLFVSILMAWWNPKHLEILKEGLIALIAVFVLSIGEVEFNLILKLFLFIAFFFYGIKLFIQVINYRGKQNAIKEYNKKTIETKYGLNKTIERIEHFLLFFISCIFIFISILVGKNDISSFVGILFLLLVLFIVANYYSKTRYINEEKFDVDKIKTILSTLMALTFIFSVILYYMLILIPVDSYFNNQVTLYPVFAFVIVIPPIIVSNYFLERLRMTFFENKNINQYFISNLLTYTIVILIITIVLSDAIVAYSVIKSQNY